jgi:hypothetical protein
MSEPREGDGRPVMEMVRLGEKDRDFAWTDDPTELVDQAAAVIVDRHALFLPKNWLMCEHPAGSSRVCSTL